MAGGPSEGGSDPTGGRDAAHGDITPTLGAGELSAEAQARVAGMAPERLDPPSPSAREQVAEWRAAVHRAWLEGDPPPSEAGHAELVVGGVRCLVAGGFPPSPPTAPRQGAGPTAVVVYLHGGGYALGSPEVAVPITAGLAAGGLAVVSVDYRLAPEHPYPAAFEDAGAVYAAVCAAVAPGPVALAGDSAGGNLAVSIALAASTSGLARPAAVVLMSPHLDLAAAAAADGDGDGRWLADAYRGTRDPADPDVSPLRAGLTDLAALPPVLVQTGTADSLLGHAVRFARRARAAGVAVTLDVWDGMWHTWQYHRELPEARQALAEAAAFVHDRVGTAPPSGRTAHTADG